MANRNGPTSGDRIEGGIDARQGAPKRLTPPAINPRTNHTILNGQVPISGHSRTETNELLSGGQLGKVNGGDAVTLLKQGHYDGNVPVIDDGRQLRDDRPHAQTHDHTLGPKVLGGGRLGGGK